MRLILTMLFGFVLSSSLRAQLTYEFIDPATLLPISSLNATVGVPISVNIVMRDLSVGATTFNADGGLGSGGFLLRYNNPSGIANVANNAAVTLFTTPNGGPWDFAGSGSITVTSTQTRVIVGAFGAAAFPDSNGRVRVAQVSLTPLAAGSTTLQVLDDPTFSGDTSSFTSSIVYDTLLSPAVLTFNVVPEPMTVLSVIAVGGLMVRRWNRRKVMA